ncbi:MAG: RHS repeat-associated core domain-containing protein [Tenericutes bacterium]|nr:RHS repeat-associated core domain-containing protein [Mycoplasmatota bacterium]
MFRKIVSIMLCVFMIGGSVIPQNRKVVYALDDAFNAANSFEEQSAYPSTIDSDFDISQIAIDSEIESERTAYTKTYRKVDGSYEIAMYNDIVHFFDEGEWKQVDNSLNDIGEEFETNANSFKLKFPKYLDDNKQIKLSMNNYGIDWNILNIESTSIEYDDAIRNPSNMKELVNVNQSVFYSNIQPNVDIEYIVSGSQIKENIILDKYIKNFCLTFEYKLKDLSLIEDEQGNIVFINDNNEIVFYFNDLYMLDDEMRESFNIEYKLINTGNKTYQITIVPDDEWLATANYPVKIDPTTVVPQNYLYFEDTTIKENYTTDYSAWQYLIVGNYQVDRRYRGLMKIQIPGGVENEYITYARLTLSPSAQNNGSQINLYRNTSDFVDSEVTWANQPDIVDTAEDFFVIDGQSKYVFDITGAMKYWQSNPNYGFSIRSANEVLSYNSVKSVECTTTSLKPLVEIGYVERAGLKDYWTYDSQSLGDAGTGYVTENNGYYTNVRNDINYSNEKTSLNLSYYYSFDTRTTNYFNAGYGWRSNYDIYWETYSSSIKYVSFGDGSTAYYNQLTLCPDWITTETGHTYVCYLSENGDGSVFVDDYYSTHSYFLYTKEGTKYTFDSNNWLNEIILINGDSYSISRNSYQNVTQVIDSYNNKIVLYYSSSNQRLMYSYLYTYDSDNSSWYMLEKNYYAYDSYVNLNYIYRFNYYDTDNPSSYDYYKRVDYNFNASHYLVDFINTRSNTKVVYSYSNDFQKIDSYSVTVNDLNMGFISFQYNPFSTTKEDHLGNKMRISFDAYGHAISTISDEGNASYSEYLNIYDSTTINYNLNNKVIQSSGTQDTQVNLIFNSTFRTQTYISSGNTGGWYKNIGITAGSMYYSTETINVAGTNYIYKITRTSDSYGTPFSLRQKLVLDEGTYVLRGKIKNPGNLDGNDLGASINIIGASTSTTVEQIHNTSDYVTVAISFTIDSDNTTVYIDLQNMSYSTAVFDDVQVDKGAFIDKFNLIQNPSFEHSTTYWTTSNATVVSTPSDDFLPDDLESNSVYLNSSTTSYQRLYQTVYGSFENGESLTYGAWIKSFIVDNSQDDSFVNMFVRIKAYNSSNQLLSTQISDVLSIQRYTQDWQYIMDSIVINNPYSSTTDYYLIEFNIEYKGGNPIYVDGVQLYRTGMFTYFDYGEISSGNGNVISVSTSTITTEYLYEDADNPFKATEVSKNGTMMMSIDYDSLGNVQNIERTNVSSDMEYDSSDSSILTSISISDELGEYYTTSVGYINNNQFMSSLIDPYGNETEYNVNVQNTLLESLGLPSGNTQYYNYDKSGMLTSTYINNHLGEAEYVYDSDDRLWKIEVDGLIYEIIYDDTTNIGIVKEIKVDGIALSTKEYETKVVGQITYYTNLVSSEELATGNTYVFEYDDDDLLIEIWYKDTPTSTAELRFKYDYDAIGRLIYFEDVQNLKTYNYTYNSIGKISRIMDENGNCREYMYDDYGQLSAYYYSINGNERLVNYDFSESLQKYTSTTYFISSTNEIEKTFNYDSDQLDRLESIFLENNGSYVFKKYINYDDDDIIVDVGDDGVSTRVNRIYYQNSGYMYTKYYFYEYEFDDIGNILEESERYLVSTPYGYTEEVLTKKMFYYDELNQLIRENVCTADCNTSPAGYTNEYIYDGFGNRTYVKTYNYTEAISLSGLTPVNISVYTYTYSWDDQLTTANGYTYSYDDSGNVSSMIDSVAGASIYYEWEGRELVGYEYSDMWEGFNVNYEYNDAGYRVEKHINSGNYLYELDGDKVLVETIPGHTLYYTYDINGILISVNIDGDEYFYKFNLLNDVIGLYDESGDLVVTYFYDSWGNLLDMVDNSGTNAGSLNPYRYRSYRYDWETNLYYLNSRYYNPETGRFISADGLIGDVGDILSHNMYAYTENNPISYVDPSGYTQAQGAGGGYGDTQPDDYWNPIDNINTGEYNSYTETSVYATQKYYYNGQEITYEQQCGIEKCTEKYEHDARFTIGQFAGVGASVGLFFAIASTEGIAVSYALILGFLGTAGLFAVAAILAYIAYVIIVNYNYQICIYEVLNNDGL